MRDAPALMRDERDELWVCHLGIVDYRDAVALQERIRAARQQQLLPDVLLMLEHWPVYTRGRRSGFGDLPTNDHSIEIVQTDRGGKLTYHGPGQLVGYPIVGVEDVVAYVRALERALVTALLEEGIRSRARPQDGPDFTGVWVGERKLASIGVHVARGVTTHGFAVNVENDLQPFSWIVPCGLDGVQMTSIVEQTDGPSQTTSIDRQTGGPSQMTCFRRRAAWHVAEALGRRQRLVSLARINSIAGQ
ncbi:MAG: lipoyl(octanoyl) transferase LipB [Solirubrobacteraceae bacterium]